MLGAIAIEISNAWPKLVWFVDELITIVVVALSMVSTSVADVLDDVLASPP